ncbi:Stp1/IreP family PP2C-type Ser/Thr phosphatase [soil metagenome]
MRVAWEAAGATHVGRLRRGNEDNFHLDGGRGLFVVADGMGGHAAGEIASEIATTAVVETVQSALAGPQDEPGIQATLSRAVLVAHDRILHCCEEDSRRRGMGTTLTCCVLTHAGRCHVGHIGDSRLYRFRADSLEQVTTDHTWVQQEVETGRLAASAARNHPLSHILTRVLSDDLTPILDIASIDILPGDVLLLCTDGLYNMLTDDVIAGALREPVSLEGQVQQLIDAANSAGGSDNITLLLVSVMEQAQNNG